MRSRDTLVGVPDAAVSAAGTAACVATLQIDTDGPHADTGWIVPVGDASRAPIEWFTVPDGSTWDEWAEPSTRSWPMPAGREPGGSCTAARQ
ncbi:hypothetical protein HQ32_00877 [Prauserella sp. Am3]|nr:hypothetical protein HQ32_00877 [Prauserella sp. Am3]